VATLLFLALDGHHWMLKACLDSYSVVGMGKAGIGQALGSEVTRLTSDVFKIALQLSAPVAVSLFTVNVAFGVLSKAIPQLNVLVLSFAVSALVGLGVLYASIPEIHEVSTQVIAKMTEWSETLKRALKDGGKHG
jgi:flagellar biosynthetic protein FliR